MPQPVSNSFQRIHTWLATNAPATLDALNPPATAAQLDELEHAVGMPLPNGLRELYSLHDGTDTNRLVSLMYGMTFLPLDQVLREINYSKEFVAEGGESLVFAEPGILQERIFHPTRIPICTDGSTCLLCVDLEPGPSGSRGQVILLDHERSVGLLIASSVEEMFDIHAKLLEDGRYSLNEDAKLAGDEWLEPDQEHDIVNWARIPRWKHILQILHSPPVGS